MKSNKSIRPSLDSLSDTACVKNFPPRFSADNNNNNHNNNHHKLPQVSCTVDG